MGQTGGAAAARAAVVLGMVAVVVLGPSAEGHGRGLIAFGSMRDGTTSEIYVMSDDGSDQRRLTWNAADDVQPDWSPDGSKIVFVSTRDGDSEIYVMDADGSTATRLTSHPGFDTEPKWSPDGTRIAYTSVEEHNSEIYIMGSDGSNPVNWTNHPYGDGTAAWSPDGSKIAFVSQRGGEAPLHVAEVDGSGTQTGVTSLGIWGGSPAWSPDGQHIAYAAISEESTGAAGPPFSNVDLFIVPSVGGSPRRLTYDKSDESHPSWSPDGSQIVFESNRDGGWGVYAMDVDGSLVVRLTDQGMEPAWSWAAPSGSTQVPQTAWGVLKSLIGR